MHLKRLFINHWIAMQCTWRLVVLIAYGPAGFVVLSVSLSLCKRPTAKDENNCNWGATSQSTPHKSPTMVGFKPLTTKGTIPSDGRKVLFCNPPTILLFYFPFPLLLHLPSPSLFPCHLSAPCPITVPFESVDYCLVWCDPAILWMLLRSPVALMLYDMC